ARNLRTLIFVYQSDYNLSTLFQHFKCLRTLTLNFEYGDTLEELPDAVENFIHLRYLNLVNYRVKFQKLPTGMGKLINLRHFILDLRYNWVKLEFPRGFGRLSSLRTLSYFNISGKDDSERCKLGELRNLNHLERTLTINGLGSNVYEAENAQLKKKIGLRTLILRARNLRTLIFVYQSDYNLSTLFQHFKCLRTLTLNFEYGDIRVKFQKLPIGMGKLINLRHFILDLRYNWVKLEFPRGFGRLSSLRTLSYFNISGKDDSERCKLGELRNLNHLEGTLTINGLGSNVYEAENAQLKKKIGLHTLILRYKHGDGVVYYSVEFCSDEDLRLTSNFICCALNVLYILLIIRFKLQVCVFIFFPLIIKVLFC
ncbi:putative disease resistance protein rga3, partial [Quercus suber]